MPRPASLCIEVSAGPLVGWGGTVRSRADATLTVNRLALHLFLALLMTVESHDRNAKRSMMTHLGKSAADFFATRCA